MASPVLPSTNTWTGLRVGVTIPADNVGYRRIKMEFTLRRNRLDPDRWDEIDRYGCLTMQPLSEENDKHSTEELVVKFASGRYEILGKTPMRDPWEVECPECGGGFLPEDGNYLCEECRAES